MTKTNNNKKEFIYIYNEEQMFFYVEKGLRFISSGVNPNTGRKWYKFNRLATKPLFDEWCSREH